MKVSREPSRDPERLDTVRKAIGPEPEEFPQYLIYEDWESVAQNHGLNEKQQHRRANPRARIYTEYYHVRTREVIANKFRVDIERFGYEFGR